MGVQYRYGLYFTLHKGRSGNSQELVQLAVINTQKMLRVWLAPNSNNRKQVEEMRNQRVAWAEKARTGEIGSEHIWQALTLSIIKK